jgi:choline-sulfatase
MMDAAGGRQAMPDRPNIVICLCDQMRPFELGCYGHGQVRTPNIDALAARGVRFETACTNIALCSPARSCLMSGQYVRTCCGMLGNIGEPESTRTMLRDPTLPELLKGLGYRTALIGKWHVQPHPSLLAMDEYVFPSAWHLNTNQTYFDDRGRTFVVEGFGPDYEAGRLSEFLAADHDRPFFLLHSICLPHMPFFDVPPRYKTMYDPAAVALRPNVWREGELPASEHWFKSYLWDHLYYRDHRHFDLPEGFDLRDLTALYWGMVSCVDDQVGHLMAQLEANGLTDNTIVLFTSDHGDNLGSHHLFNKECNKEESVRIPLVISWPGVLGARVIGDQLCGLVDVLPTLLGLLGAPVPDHVQGADLSAVVRGQRPTAGENVVFLESWIGEVSIRTPTHKYGVMTTNHHADLERLGKPVPGGYVARVIIDDRDHFYDLVEDPYEMNNLAKTGQQQRRARRLRQRVLEWNRNTPWLNG